MRFITTDIIFRRSEKLLIDYYIYVVFAVFWYVQYYFEIYN